MSAARGSIETARLRLDPLSVDDADEMARVLADPSLYLFTGGEPPDVEALRARYEAQVRGRSPDGTETWRTWIVRLRATGEAIGYVQATIVDVRREADLAWVLGPDAQGRGLATEAASAVVARLADDGVARFTAHVRADHAASEGVARRIGLRPTDRVEDGERVWRLDVPARMAARRRRLGRLHLGAGAALVGFAAYEAALASGGRLPGGPDQVVRDAVLAIAGAVMLAGGLRGLVVRR